MLRKCSSCSLLMYCSPRLTMYGCTLRGPASRLPGSMDSASSGSLAPAGAARLLSGGAGGTGRGGFFASTAAGAGGACGASSGLRGATATLLRAGATASGRAGRPGSLRVTAFLTVERLTAFLPFADFGAALLAVINGSSKQLRPLKNARLYRRLPACTGACDRL